MPVPQSLVLRLVLAAGLGVLADPRSELRVLRVTPSGEAAPTTSVTVTFDRPVAGSLDRTVDPRAVFTIAPAVAGTLDGRGRGAQRLPGVRPALLASWRGPPRGPVGAECRRRRSVGLPRGRRLGSRPV